MLALHKDDFVIISLMIMYSLDSVSVILWNDPGQIMKFCRNPWTSVIIIMGAEV